MGITYTNNDNYSTLSANTKTAVGTAVTAIRAAFASANTEGDAKENVRAVLKEIINLEEAS